MDVYYGTATIHPMAEREGQRFVALAIITNEAGDRQSTGIHGQFASESAACRFAVRSASAFLEGQVLPLPPISNERHLDVGFLAKCP
ncbi:hypothetical protein AWB65_06464 [Caballeronia humi]|uniref:Uncharacterized protein n=1 Tax=Caballeronia humi TaxID=326474 RepID=A0A158JEC8_9BURK|nr:hypothetical protein AWB65_06464 [Caballeronia humi]